MRNFLVVIFMSLISGFALSGQDPIETENYDSGALMYEIYEDGFDYKYILYHEDGGVWMKGGFDEYGHKSGVWIIYYESGTICRTTSYSSGYVDGYIRYYNEDGRLTMSGHYSRGSRDGVFRMYDDIGNLIKTKTYKNGETIDSWESTRAAVVANK